MQTSISVSKNSSKRRKETNRKSHRRLSANLKRFFTDAWIDLLTIVGVGGLSAGVWMASHAFTRYFPVNFAASPRAIILPELAYPYIKPIFSSLVAGVVCVCIPILVILVSQIWLRSFNIAAYALLGLGYSIATGTCFQLILKKTVGGLRPHFLAVCKPVLPVDRGKGHGFRHVMWTIDQVCTGDRKLVTNATESFPSGHSEVAFAGLLYCSIYLSAHLRLRQTQRQRRPAYWKMLVVIAPILLAVYLSATLVLGYHHHVHDVIFGALIGILMAIFAYRMVFAGVWNCAMNTIPLVRSTTNGGRSGEDDENIHAHEMTSQV